MTEAVINWFHHLGVLTMASAVALCVIFLLTAFVVVPRTVLILAAGATFGLAAAPIILLSGTTGGILAFLSSRYIAANWFKAKLVTRPVLRAIAQAVDDEGWRIIALMRLGAPLPSAMQNYLFGLTNVDIVTYSIATLVFSAPQVFLFSFLGATGRASLLQDGSSGLPLGFSLIALLLAATTIALISWRVRMLLSRLES
ncbi:VTT domain-containing protein [Bradyrhizobium sp. 76]|uniref:TVP38/TMEM64 family protein n=1 Tax=Bradyrhizobium sp. 76 TaxID=2782680 RepID=UPI001FF8FD40|nr:VTT domain-containing protein [Bradyrhizobium sp. 76]MCK1408101.1 TVP38/TMEM64 family protein [Bradyrhizobium sp. 76]